MSTILFEIGFASGMVTNALLFAAVARLWRSRHPSRPWRFLIDGPGLWKSAQDILAWRVDGGEDRTTRALILGVRVFFVATILAGVGFLLSRL